MQIFLAIITITVLTLTFIFAIAKSLGKVTNIDDPLDDKWYN